MTTTLSTSNPFVVSFYEKHNLDFESINIIFVKLMEEMFNGFDKSINSSNIQKLFEGLHRIENKISHLSNDFSNKLLQTRNDYIQDMKTCLTLSNVEHIIPIIRETNSSLVDKLSIIINDISPKCNEYIKKEIQIHFQELQNSLLKDTNRLLSSSLNKKDFDDFFLNFNNMITQYNNNLCSFISSTESRIGGQVNDVKDMMREKDFSHIGKNLQDLLVKFENSTEKGAISENILYNILLSKYKSAEIVYVGDKKETGDIIFQQKGKPKILIENKDHESHNVPKADVSKFIRDCDIQNCCGIMLAQHRGITNKNDFELQFNNGNVLLYVHKVKFDIEKISMAIDIVENFKIKMDEMNISHSDIVINKDIMNDINNEFMYFVNQKSNLLKYVKDIGEKINELRMPQLEHFLGKRFALSTKQMSSSVCEFCKEPVKKSLKQHYRYCQVKKNMEALSVNTESCTNEDDDEEDE